ncbi:MAG: MBL fold metallo-hydrolase [Methanobacteriota archaeon]|nr:MAG: MBL fold metallo-hydrolase [Euryarchaeota archaeon]
MNDEHHSLRTVMVLYTPGRTSGYPEEPVESGIRLHFLGGGDEVGNVGCLLEDRTGTRVLIDYGLAPTRPPRYPKECPPIEHTIITHSHIDHIGMAPWLVGQYGAALHGTTLTAAVSEIMWRDTYKVSSIEGYPLPWDKRDLDAALNAWQTHDVGEWFEIGEWKCRFHRAGHIPGAIMIEIETPELRLLWSGDIDIRDGPNVRGAEPINCDILCLEATYGGREHPVRATEEARFVSRVKEVVSRGGVVLVPAFASGRCQDVLRILHRAAPHLNVHFDGMGTRLTRHWLSHPEHTDEPEHLKQVWNWARIVSSKSDRKKALDADVIVTTSGMLDGGPAIWYLNRLRHDSANAILLTGYQAEGSGGHRLLEKGSLRIFGNETAIDLEVTQFQLSNHAGHSDLVSFVRACEPRHVVLFHGDDDARSAIAAEFTESPAPSLPLNGETLNLS